MPDSLDDWEWEGIISRAERDNVSTEGSLRDWLEFWETGRHKIKNGFTESGQQKFKEVTPQPMSPKTRQLGQEIADYFKIDEYFEKRDIKSLNRLAFENNNTISNNRQESSIYNLAGTIYREARNENNLSKLQELRNEINNTIAQAWVNDVQESINKLNEGFIWKNGRWKKAS